MRSVAGLNKGRRDIPAGDVREVTLLVLSGRQWPILLVGLQIALVVVGCSPDSGGRSGSGSARMSGLAMATTTAPPSDTPVRPTASATPSRTPSPTPSPTLDPTPAVIGPDYLEGFDPLTGLAVSDPQDLLHVPLLVSISEFPPSARPQAGLSFADQVWETSIGQGMTRFLAVYYGDYLDHFRRLLAADPELDSNSTVIGPVRSGRIGYEQIKDLYPGGLLFIRSASPEVARQLTDIFIVYASDTQDVNSATLSLSELEALDIPAAEPADYSGLVFDSRPPLGGQPAASLSIIYNLYDQIEWTYDPSLRKYLRSQDPADGSGRLEPSVDRLTGARLAADNVVVMFAQHTFENRGATILGIELVYVPKRYGILFRDGKMFDISWSSPKAVLSFIDDSGEPVAFRPGTTYFQVVSYESTWDSEDRIVRFHNPPLPTEPPPPVLTPNPSKTPTPEGGGPT